MCALSAGVPDGRKRSECGWHADVHFQWNLGFRVCGFEGLGFRVWNERITPSRIDLGGPPDMGGVCARARKVSLMAGNALNVLGTLMFTFSGTFGLMFAGRFIMGLGAGIAFMGPELYACEVLIHYSLRNKKESRRFRFLI